MAYTVYGLQALANGLIDQVRKVDLYAGETLVDTFTWDTTNPILVADGTLGKLKKKRQCFYRV